MRVLITGVTGFIGSTVAERLVANGHEVIGLTRDPAKAEKALPFIQKLYAWKPEEEPSPSLLATADAVLHLAGESVAGRWTTSKKERIYQSRVVGTRNLVTGMLKTDHPKVLVSASAVGLYGDRGEEELTEASRIGEGFLSDVCKDWEREALEAAQEGVRVVVMRLGIVMGKQGGALKTMLPLFRWGMGGPLGSGKQWWPWVHIHDVASGLMAAIERPYQGAYNLTAPEPARQKEFASVLGSVLRRPAFLPVPGFALRMAQGEFADEVLFSKRVMPARLLSEGFRFEYPDLAQALSDIMTTRELDEDVLASA